MRRGLFLTRSSGARRTLRAGTKRRRGSVLIAVLWLSAALAAIAFSVAATVRGETERAATLADGLRTYYLACGGLERALMHASHNTRNAAPPKPGEPPVYSLSTPLMRFDFPSGRAIVEVIPETSRLNVNDAEPGDLANLLMVLGAEPPRAAEIAAAIADWRSASPLGPFDQFYLSRSPSFRARHASFQEVEEVLLVKGMTPDLFYGSYVHTRNDRLERLGGFRDCVTVFGQSRQFDINTVEPALLIALGAQPDAVRQIVALRRVTPILDVKQLGGLAAALGPAAPRVRAGGGNTIYTFRSTARLRLPGNGLPPVPGAPDINPAFSDVRRTVSAQVKFLKPGSEPRYHILRWSESATSEVALWQ